MAKSPMTDDELNNLLSGATQPPLPTGFANRLQARLDAPVASNVIAFPQKVNPAAKSMKLWFSAIPLAASLAAGLYLGAQGTLADSIGSLNTSLVSDATDTLFDIGIEDTESFINGELS
jgi:hypothetical protein